MNHAAGTTEEGIVTGITGFGAFVRLNDGVSGLAHISEIADTYVKDIHDHLQVGQSVKVKILSVTADGKLNLSVKQAAPREGSGQGAPREGSGRGAPKPAAGVPVPRKEPQSVATEQGELYTSSGDSEFESRLKQFMQESDSKISGSRLYSDRRQGGRRRK